MLEIVFLNRRTGLCWKSHAGELKILLKFNQLFNDAKNRRNWVEHLMFNECWLFFISVIYFCVDWQDVVPKDNGTYTCVAKNRYGEDSKMGELTVRSKSACIKIKENSKLCMKNK